MSELRYPGATDPHDQRAFRFARKIAQTIQALGPEQLREVELFRSATSRRYEPLNVTPKNRPDLGSMFDGKQFRLNAKGKMAHKVANWMNRKLGQGSYGVVYVVKATERALAEIRKIVRTSTYFVRHRDVAPNQEIALKLAPYLGAMFGAKHDKAMGKVWLDDHVREAALHAHLVEQPPIRVPGYGRTLKAYAHLPTFYFGGLTKATDSTSYYVTIMDVVKGDSVWQIMRDNKFDAEVYLHVELAVCSLWVNGVVHGDLHSNNVLYSDNTRKAMLLDLGRAVFLPETFRRHILEKLPCAVASGVKSLGELFWPRSRSKHGIDGLQTYVNSVMAGKRLKLYYSDAGVLMRQFYNSLHETEKKRVPKLRKELWQQLPDAKRKANSDASGPSTAKRGATGNARCVISRNTAARSRS